MKKPCRECKHYEKCCKDAGFSDAQWERAYNIRDGKDCWVEREKEATQWISVKDRLPERTGRFLTWTGKARAICTFLKGESDGVWILRIEDLVTEEDQVTHWMPLPEPPNGE